MDFVSGRDNGSGLISEEQEHSSARGKLPFSYSSSPSSSSSSTHQYKSGPALVPLNNWDSQIYETHNNPHQRLYGAPPHTKLELMDSSSRNNDVVNEIRRSGESDHQNTSAAGSSIEREHMFDKVVTPSDVGKLNRLVIPKQHAEKYFPLDSSTNEKGLLLNFEDRNGKPWRFRYSYWNSSQSYVMTKGWSRFVKEKKLDAGDIVSFQRGVGELGKDHLYIDWRRRPDAPDNNSVLHANIPFHHPHHLSFHPRSFPWNPLLMRPPHQVAASVLAPRDHLPQQLNYGPNSYIHRNIFNSNSYGYGNVVNSTPASAAGPVFYLRSAVQGEDQHGRERIGGFEQPVFESVPVVEGKAAAKRLRLFGVNMDCPISESDDECEVLTSATVSNVQPLQLSSSSRPPVQLRLYNGTPLQVMPTNHHHHDFVNKGKNSKSFDFDI